MQCNAGECQYWAAARVLGKKEKRAGEEGRGRQDLALAICHRSFVIDHFPFSICHLPFPLKEA
jgi:hypothetical protein